MRFVRSEGAISSVLGIVLLFGILILVGMVTVYSASAYYDMKDVSSTQKVEKAFAQFDLQAGETALQAHSMHVTQVPAMGGLIEIKGDSKAYDQSHIKVQFFDDGKPVDEIYCPMGWVEYSYGDRKVIYESGGTWSRYPDGQTLMLTPPEFSYKEDTLQLPIMTIKGSSSESGDENIVISASSDEVPVVMYPNANGEMDRENPITCDAIRVCIKSEFYRQWAEYAVSLDLDSVSADDDSKTAIIYLDVIPPTTGQDIASGPGSEGDISYLYITTNELDVTMGS